MQLKFTKKAFDPHCHEGIVNTEMTACCTADCGECHDGSPTCKAAAKNGRGSTCCPSQMLKEKVPACDVSMAPCAVPDSVRNPETQTFGAVHAKDDCNKVVKATSDDNHVATAYIKWEKKSCGATTDSSKSYSTAAQIAAACSNSDDCMGFVVASDGTPKHLLVAGNDVKELSVGGDDTYLKREDAFTGETFHFTVPVFGECSATCGGGTQTSSAVEACMTTAGVTRKLGMCSGLVAMNADAQPAYTRDCNEHDCPTSTTTSTSTAS